MMSLQQMNEGCPDELKKNLKEIVSLSRDFMADVDIDVDEDLVDIKYDLQSARGNLYKIFGRFITLVRLLRPTEENSLLDLGMRSKFEEDIGSVMASLRIIDVTMGSTQEQINFFLKYSIELQTAFDFLVFQPITAANNSEFKTVTQYMLHIFNIISSNASVIGYASRSPSQSASGIVSKKSSGEGRKMMLKAFENARDKSKVSTKKGKKKSKKESDEELKEELMALKKEQEGEVESDLSFETT